MPGAGLVPGAPVGKHHLAQSSVLTDEQVESCRARRRRSWRTPGLSFVPRFPPLTTSGSPGHTWPGKGAWRIGCPIRALICRHQAIIFQSLENERYLSTQSCLKHFQKPGLVSSLNPHCPGSLQLPIFFNLLNLTDIKSLLDASTRSLGKKDPFLAQS